MTERSGLEARLEEVLLRLVSLQKESGEFQTKELYPLDFPEQGWIDGIPSPFITSSALLSLMEIKKPQGKIIMENGLGFINSRREHQLWRFWDNKLAQNKVPLDADDTALCSFLVEHVAGKTPSNKKLLLANRNSDGFFLTWFLPRIGFITNPLFLLQLYKDQKGSANTVAQQMLAPDDYELSIIANVLLYMGQNAETQKNVDFVIDTMLQERPYECHFYDEPVFTWYHISRAYKYSVKDFGRLKDVFLKFAKLRIASLNPDNDLPLATVLANVCHNFGFWEGAGDLREMLDRADIQKLDKPYPYFTSKNRRYRAGAAGLTLAWYAEYLNNAITHFA
jgi:hypothetical protein